MHNDKNQQDRNQKNNAVETNCITCGFDGVYAWGSMFLMAGPPINGGCRRCGSLWNLSSRQKITV